MGREDAIKRYVILCVDRDNDLGSKTFIRSPVVGRDEVLNAATKLALSDPEDADANAMFEAVRLYDKLRSSASPGEEYEVAVITGSEKGGMEADRKVISELSEILSTFKADEAILVTDGFSDEEITPLLQSRLPISSIRRVVVKHSRSIEETAAVISRYARSIFEDPRYAKLVLGVPGAIILFVVGLWILDMIFKSVNVLLYATIGFLLGLGGIFCIKGFQLDKLAVRLLNKLIGKLSRFKFPHPLVQICAFLYLVGFLTMGAGAYFAYSRIAEGLPTEAFSSPPTSLLAWGVANFSLIPMIGVCIILVGRAAHLLYKRDRLFWYCIPGIVLCIWIQRVLSAVFEFILNPVDYAHVLYTTMIGVALLIASSAATIWLRAKVGKVVGN